MRIVNKYFHFSEWSCDKIGIDRHSAERVKEMTNDQLEARLADIEKKYWLIIEDELYVKQGQDSSFASLYYAHTDPAGVVHWRLQQDSGHKTTKLQGDWSGGPIPVATMEDVQA